MYPMTRVSEWCRLLNRWSTIYWTISAMTIFPIIAKVITRLFIGLPSAVKIVISIRGWPPGHLNDLLIKIVPDFLR